MDALKQRSVDFVAAEIRYQSRTDYPDVVGGLATINVLECLDLLTAGEANSFREELAAAVENRRSELHQENIARILSV